MTELLKEIVPQIALYAFLGLILAIGFLWKSGYLVFSPNKANGAEQAVTRKEFTEAMSVLRREVEMATSEAAEAKSSAQAAANNMENIAKIIQNSLANLGDRFDTAIDKLDSTVDRAIARLDNHESRISNSEGVSTQIEKRIERLES